MIASLNKQSRCGISWYHLALINFFLSKRTFASLFGPDSFIFMPSIAIENLGKCAGWRQAGKKENAPLPIINHASSIFLPHFHSFASSCLSSAEAFWDVGIGKIREREVRSFSPFSLLSPKGASAEERYDSAITSLPSLPKFRDRLCIALVFSQFWASISGSCYI